MRIEIRSHKHTPELIDRWRMSTQLFRQLMQDVVAGRGIKQTLARPSYHRLTYL